MRTYNTFALYSYIPQLTAVVSNIILSIHMPSIYLPNGKLNFSFVPLNRKQQSQIRIILKFQTYGGNFPQIFNKETVVASREAHFSSLTRHPLASWAAAVSLVKKRVQSSMCVGQYRDKECVNWHLCMESWQKRGCTKPGNHPTLK